MALPFQVTLLLGFSLLLSFFPLGRKVLFPFQVFTTWVHECWHALTAALLGASSIKITIATDGSGLTHYSVGSGRLRQAVIASAGYLGASFTGCAIFYLSATHKSSHSMWSTRSLVLALSGLVALSLVFWIRNGFGVVVALTLGGVLASLHYPPLNRYAENVLLFLAIQTALNALFDIRTLFGLSKKTKSDAHTMQKLFLMPYWFWAFAWLGVSLWMIYFTARLVAI